MKSLLFFSLLSLGTSVLSQELAAGVETELSLDDGTQPAAAARLAAAPVTADTQLTAGALGLSEGQTLTSSSANWFGATSTCTELRRVLGPAKVALPGEAAYTATNSNYWDQRGVKAPTCIVLPTTAQEVGLAVKTLALRLTRFAVKSGGHMPGEFTNIDNGVLIATEKLNMIQFADGDTTLRIGPGNRWGPVLEKAAEKGKVVVSGRLAQVGTAGLVIGGGISWLSGQYGWACDNVKGFEVVLVSGQVVYAAPNNQYADLFKVLRGGGSNFGIVTRIDLETFNLPLGWASIGGAPLNVDPSGALKTNFLDAVYNYAKTGQSANPDTGVIAVITSAPSQGLELATTALWKSAPQSSVPAVFQPFLNNPYGQYNNANMRMYDLAKFFADQAGQQPPSFNAFRSNTFIADRNLIFEIARIHKEEFDKISDVTGLNHALTFQPVTPQMVTVGHAKRGGNVLGINARASSGPFIITEMQVSWYVPSDTPRVQQAQRTIAKRAKDYARARGLLDPFVYLNDADTEQTDEVFAGYGSGNRAYLTLVKLKYDPLGVLTFLMPGGFKIW